MKIIKSLLYISTSLLIYGCGGSGGSDSAILNKSVAEPAGDHCPNGGTLILSGNDLNSDGNLSSDEIVTYRYECDASNWTQAKRVGDTKLYTSLIDLLVMSNGDRLLVYQQDKPILNSGYDYYMDYFDASTQQTRTELIPYGPRMGDSSLGQFFAMDENGHAISVWAEEKNSLGSVWASRYSANLGWQTPEKVMQSNTTHVPSLSQIPDVDVLMLDDLDSALVIARYVGDSNWAIHSSHYTDGGPWSIVENLEENPSANALSAQAKFDRDRNGNAVAIWYRNGRIYANRYRYRVGWEGAIAVDSGTTISECECTIAVSESGIAVAQWREIHDNMTQHWAAIYRPGTGWGAAFNLSILSAFKEIDLAFTATDEIWLTWIGESEDKVQVWLSKVIDEVNIEHSLLDEKSGVTVYGYIRPQIATDYIGNAVIVWPGDNRLWAKYYDVEANTWSDVEMVAAQGADRDSVKVDMYGVGAAVLSWSQTQIYDMDYNSHVLFKQLNF